jgi:hypothetical protein
VSIQPARCAANERVNGLAAVRTFLQIVSSFGIIVGLLAAVAAVMRAFCWTVLLLVRFVPVIGRWHRHPRGDELTKRSGRGA